MTSAPRWDLDSIFKGGSSSTEFAEFRRKVEGELGSLEEQIAKLPRELTKEVFPEWTKFVLDLQTTSENVGLVMSFSICLISQDVSDQKAQTFSAAGDSYNSRIKKVESSFESIASRQADDIWQEFLTLPKISEISFLVDEIRTIAKTKMKPELESLAIELSVNGYHAWNRIYDKMAGDIFVEFEHEGEKKKLSLGQLVSKFSDPDRDVRKQAFEKMTDAWKSRAELAAMMLNSQAGFRLGLYKNRGWDSVVFEPLQMQRMSSESLDAMWRVVSSEKHRLSKYIKAKSRYLGIEKNCWYDQLAPCGKSDKKITFDEAGKFIVENLRPVSKSLSDFCKMALDKRWIEAEDRPGKAAGGYCTGMGNYRQTRIFMTYGETYDGVATLAHELGHSYHTWVLKDKPFFATRYTLPVGEMASTFNELVVVDAAIDASEDRDSKLAFLDQKLQNAYVFICNIHARYLFDKAFYEARKEGVVDADSLNTMMIDAQREGFGGLLDEYHPHFWCSKLHFYLTDTPFYNYPYTVGYLLSVGLYDLAKREGANFEEKYVKLLEDTGCMTVDGLVKNHFGYDLSEETFWKNSIDRAFGWIDEFTSLLD
jgi:oligoendopeptidase F